MPLEPSDLLPTGRVAVVTGAASGLGAAIAEGFARCGADLAVCDRDAPALERRAAELRAAGRRVHAAALDVRDGPAVERFVAAAAAALGPLDVLVNNAGGTFHAPFLELSQKGQDALVHENFASVTHFVRAFVPFVPESGGAIVNVSSIEASRAAPGFAVYAAMKAAVESLTRSLALELAARRIRVNCIAPDAIATPGMGDALPPVPLPDAGRPEDVAGAAVYLASPAARFVTGAVLHVDGGEHAAGGWRRSGGGFAL